MELRSTLKVPEVGWGAWGLLDLRISFCYRLLFENPSATVEVRSPFRGLGGGSGQDVSVIFESARQIAVEFVG